MVKLSQKAWNNVIIISMLVLIVMFNASSNFLNGGADDPDSPQLLPPGTEITTLDFGTYKVERIGRAWRAVGIAATEQQLSQLVRAWQDAETQALSDDVSLAQTEHSSVVQIYLVGQVAPLRFELFKLPDTTVVNTGKRLVKLRKENYQTLILEKITDA